MFRVDICIKFDYVIILNLGTLSTHTIVTTSRAHKNDLVFMRSQKATCRQTSKTVAPALTITIIKHTCAIAAHQKKRFSMGIADSSANE